MELDRKRAVRRIKGRYPRFLLTDLLGDRGFEGSLPDNPHSTLVVLSFLTELLAVYCLVASVVYGIANGFGKGTAKLAVESAKVFRIIE